MVTKNTGPLDGDVPVPLDGTPFALLHRPHATGPDRLELLLGDVTTVERLDALPLDADADAPDPDPAAAGGGHELLALLPYRQIAERGYTCTDDGAPLTVLTVREQHSLPTGRFLSELSGGPLALRDEEFDIPDDEYAQIVRKVIDEEIGQGAGANFVIKRAFTATIDGYTPAAALTFFSRLLAREAGAYWTFLVHTGQRTFVGASPERHVSLESGTVTMNPISGTYRYPETGSTVDGALGLLADRKEREELQMVVDEELKMMARICDPGLRVEGPFLKEMARLAHTEYFIKGRAASTSATSCARRCSPRPSPAARWRAPARCCTATNPEAAPTTAGRSRSSAGTAPGAGPWTPRSSSGPPRSIRTAGWR